MATDRTNHPKNHLRTGGNMINTAAVIITFLLTTILGYTLSWLEDKHKKTFYLIIILMIIIMVIEIMNSILYAVQPTIQGWVNFIVGIVGFIFGDYLYKR